MPRRSRSARRCHAAHSFDPGVAVMRAGRDTANICRVVRFQPYRKGMGPTFILTLWDGFYGRAATGQEYMRYELTMREPGRKTVVLFEGRDFGRAPGDTSDGDATVAGIMGFLTLREGDTDNEYFAGYTAEQLAFSEQHAEALSCEVAARFEREGR